jgi:Ca2+-binding EF-hand superfamily protein
MYEDDNDQAEQLFSIIDLDGSGYIDQSELAHIKTKYIILLASMENYSVQIQVYLNNIQQCNVYSSYLSF